MSTLPGFSLASRLRAGETVHSAWCGLAAPIIAELIAREGFSAVTLDAQHGMWDFAGLQTAIASIRQAGSAAMVRTALNDFGSASRLLDVGAEGIIAPMINNAADARALANVTKYPPLGERSFGPMRAMELAGIANPKDYVFQANDNLLAIALIETRTAVENVDEIVATPGIDGLFVGPIDLSIALSDGQMLDAGSPEVNRALDRVLEEANKHGKFVGIYCFEAEQAARFEKRGVRLFLTGSDTAYLRAGAGAALKALRRG